MQDISIFGRNVLGVLNGNLELHGSHRSESWLELLHPVNAGDDQLVLMHDASRSASGLALDWRVGEQIVVASSDFSGRHAEQRTIISVSNAAKNPIITVD